MVDDKDIILIRPPQLTPAESIYVSGIVKAMITTLRHMFSRKVTVQYPEEHRTMSVENLRGFHRLNRDPQGRVKCVACMMCETTCPAHCIRIIGAPAPWPDREKYPISFVIDELRCIYCGMCEQACPVAAIELTYVIDPIGYTRQDMLFDIDMLLDLHDQTIAEKPQVIPKITGYETQELTVK